MNVRTVLLDANILFPAPIRDIFLQLALADAFRARWTAEIHEEWIGALMRIQPHRDKAVLERTRSLMDKHVPDCLVRDYEGLIPKLELPDPNDRHVLAAAIAGRCDAIVTGNLRDFPETALAPCRIEALHPDRFLSEYLNAAPDMFCAAIRKIRARLNNPPYGVDEYLAILQRVGLTATASALARFSERL